METKYTENGVDLTPSAEVNLRNGQKVVVGDRPLVTQRVVEIFMDRPHEEIIAAVQIPVEEGSELLVMIARATDGSGEVTLIHFPEEYSDGTTVSLGTDGETTIGSEEGALFAAQLSHTLEPMASDRHCIITVQKGEVGITDTSENGTRVFLGSAEEPFSTR